MWGDKMGEQRLRGYLNFSYLGRGLLEVLKGLMEIRRG